LEFTPSVSKGKDRQELLSISDIHKGWGHTRPFEIRGSEKGVDW
jgi:hypothetical protein